MLTLDTILFMCDVPRCDPVGDGAMPPRSARAKH
jgi:hypothetical protein